MRRVLVTLWLGALLFAARQASAQVAPYATFTAGHYSGIGVGPGTASTQSGGITALGGIFGVYDDFPTYYGGPVRAGADFRVLVANSANSTPYGNKLLAGMVGFRVDGSGAPQLPVIPYAQFEIGVAGTNNGTSYNRTSSFAYQVQIGGDFPLVVPGLDGRLEYGTGQLTNIGNTNHTLQTFSIGLVYRIPR